MLLNVKVVKLDWTTEKVDLGKGQLTNKVLPEGTIKEMIRDPDNALSPAVMDSGRGRIHKSLL